MDMYESIHSYHDDTSSSSDSTAVCSALAIPNSAPTGIQVTAKHFIFEFQTTSTHEPLRCKGCPQPMKGSSPPWLLRDTTCNEDPLSYTLWSILSPFQGL